MSRAQYSLIDADFEAALFRAEQLDSWEDRVLINSVTLGFHYQNWLDANLQATLEQSLMRLTDRSPNTALTIARRYGQEAALCQWLAHPDRVRECQ